ncbi:MAG TPA: aminotransferase class I/II-fold pyridoxal phosphate-dependent enzyme, partial [Aquabacterium sp.]|nr:aminotransferase class I/II-fold pyridoxal phosphate-dependent enzyme [Aquabacterium sp.]
MTGWRLGWMVLPRGSLDPVAKLIEFNNSCAPVFVQRGGLAALASAEASVPSLVQHLRLCRDTLHDALATLPGVRVARPLGGMYAFLQVAEAADSLAFAKRLVSEHGLGLAPGAAFGDEGEGWLRWCFASRDPSRLLEGVERLRRALSL